MPKETSTVDNPATDATTAADDTTASSAATDAKPPGSLLDAVRKSASDKGVKLSDTSPEDDPQDPVEEPEVPEKPPVKPAAPDTETKEEPEVEEPKAEPEKPVDPLDTLGEKFKNNPGVQNLIKEYREAKPEVEYARGIKNFQSQNRIPDQLMQATMNMAALLVSNRGEALKQLKPLIAQLEQENGLGELPPDLKQAVAEGEMSESWARKLAESQAQARIASQTAQQRAADSAAFANKTALETWQESKARSDTDFAKKYPMVEAEFLRIVTFERATTQDQLVSAAEKAYAKVNEQLKGFVPRPPVKKTFRPNGSSASTHRAEPQTLGDVVKAAYARHQ